MYYFLLIIMVVLVNFLIYSVLKGKDDLIQLLGYCVIIFFGIALVTKIYDFFIDIDNMPKSKNISIFLSFSWDISLMYLIKKVINKRVDVYKQLDLAVYIGRITFLNFFTILMTLFQLYLIFSKEIFELN